MSGTSGPSGTKVHTALFRPLFQRRHPAEAGDAQRVQHAPRLPLHHGLLLHHPRHRRLLHREVGR